MCTATMKRTETTMPTAVRRSGPLRVERLDSGRRRLLRDLVIDLGTDLGLGSDKFDGFSLSDDGDTVITVPEDFDTDFSSIPWFARSLYRFDAVDLAGTCHDWAYFVGVPRKEADEIWRLVAISGERRAKGWQGRLGWLALRLLGGIAYSDHARRRAKRRAAAPPSNSGAC